MWSSIFWRLIWRNSAFALRFALNTENDQSHGLYIPILAVLPHTTLQVHRTHYTYRISISPQRRSVQHVAENLTQVSSVLKVLAQATIWQPDCLASTWQIRFDPFTSQWHDEMGRWEVICWISRCRSLPLRGAWDPQCHHVAAVGIVCRSFWKWIYELGRMMWCINKTMNVTDD